MLQNIAYGGTQGTSLYTNSISSSPHLPQQYSYADRVPTQSYHAFAARAGCLTPWAHNSKSRTIFQCLISQDTAILQAASNTVSQSGRHGTWVFLPVTDGTFIPSTPSTALSSGHLNGVNRLTTNAAEESLSYVPQNISTPQDLHAYLSLLFPLFTPTDHAALLHHYPSSSSPHNTPIPRSPTPGSSNPTALDTSATASGHQQTANLIYAESTFVCPSHWLAAAYTARHENSSSNNIDGRGYKAQSSTPIALHGIDDTAIFGNRPLPIYGNAYMHALQRVWGAFVNTGNPSVRDADVDAVVRNWPVYSAESHEMVNLNQTGGTVESVDATLLLQLEGLGARWAVEPGLRTDFAVVDGWRWERGRGARCEFWREVAGRVPI